MVAHDSLLLLQALGPLKEHPNERLADGLLADRPFQQAVERGRYGFTTAILALAPVEPRKTGEPRSQARRAERLLCVPLKSAFRCLLLGVELSNVRRRVRHDEKV